MATSFASAACPCATGYRCESNPRFGQQQLPFTALLRSIDETAAAIAA
jgi:hypothetical protein